MGEYALNRRGERVKIGTCEQMYYLRAEDRDKVVYDDGKGKFEGCFFRPPFIDEDHIEPGMYEESFRRFPLPEYDPGDDVGPLIESPGIIQLTHESGLLVNVPCYHGLKLPDHPTERTMFHWNGKAGWFFCLAHVKLMDDGTYRPVIGCRFCRELWRCDWDDVLPAVERADKAFADRLRERYVGKAAASC